MSRNSRMLQGGAGDGGASGYISAKYIGGGGEGGQKGDEASQAVSRKTKQNIL